MAVVGRRCLRKAEYEVGQGKKEEREVGYS